MAGALVLAALVPGLAWAGGPGDAGDRTQVQLDVPQEASLGDIPVIRARLTASDGTPVRDALIAFFSPGAIGGAEGEMAIGSARTDAAGTALLEYELRRTGSVTVIARFDGSEGYAASTTQASLSVSGERQLYTPEGGLNVPVLGPWLLVLVLGTVWGLYLLVAGKVFAIARAGAAVPVPQATVPVPQAAGWETKGASRRQFLTRWMVPMGMHGAVVALGSGLITVILRSPDTHAHLRRFNSRSRYRRTPFVLVSQQEKLRPLPPVLDREVSFSREVLPLFRAKGGPHFFQPRNSPPPAGVRLDSYGPIMAKEGLVVPGNPEGSELVQVLRTEAMRMPPAGNPLNEEDIQLVASWIAQGARNT